MNVSSDSVLIIKKVANTIHNIVSATFFIDDFSYVVL